MNQTPDLSHASDLSSGFFFKTIPYRTPEEITQINDPEHVLFFLDLLQNKYRKIVCTVVENRPISKLVNSKIIKSENSFFIEGHESGYEGQISVFLKDESKTFYFTCHLDKSGKLDDISAVTHVHRRLFKRYSIQDLGIEVSLEWESHRTNGFIQDISLGGIKVNSLEEAPALFSRVQLCFLYEHTRFVFEGSVSNANDTKGDKSVGIKIDNDKFEFKSKFYIKLIDHFGLRAAILKGNEDKESLVKCFSSAVNPQPFDESLLKNDPKGATFVRFEKDGSPSASISQYCLNEKLTLLHTLVLQPEHVQRLPIELYEYANCYIQAQGRIEYFCGFWPSKNKLLDRAYTSFVKAEYNENQHYFSQFSIYQIDNQKIENVPGDYEVRPYKMSDFQNVYSIFKQQTNDVYLDSFCIKESIKLPKGNLFVLEKDGLICGVSFLKKSKSNLHVFGLVNQAWMFFKDCTIGSRSIDFFIKGLKNQFKDDFSVLINFYDTDLVNASYIRGCIKDVYFWIADISRARRFLSHLEQINFEIDYITKSKNKLTKNQLKFFRSNRTIFKRRNSLRVKPESLNNDIQVKLQFNGMSLSLNRLTSIDTFGIGAEIPSNLLLEKGLKVRVSLTIGALVYSDIECEVKYCHSNMSSSFQTLHNVIGLGFTNLDLKSAEGIKDYCFTSMNAELKNILGEDYTELTSLLTRSKYFEYYDSSKRERFIGESEDTYKSLDALVPDLARVTVLKDASSKVIGTHAFYRRSEKTWQLHQLVVDEGRALYKSNIPTKTILKGSFEYLCLDPSVDYFITYFHNDAAIGKTYFDVGNHHDDPGDFSFVPFIGFLYEDIADRPPNTIQSEYKISEPSEGDLKEIGEFLESSMSRVEFEAMDYINLLQNDFNEKWRKKGFQRDRKIFVLKTKTQELLHFAICDVSPKGINLIGLVDIFRTFDIPWRASVNRKSSLTLLCNHVVGFYKSLDRSQVYLEIEPELMDSFIPSNARNLGKNWRLVASRNTFMTTLQYFNARFERLEKRLLRKNAKKE